MEESARLEEQENTRKPYAFAWLGGDATAAMDHASSATTKRYLDPRLVGEVSTCQFVGQWRKAKKD